MALTVDQFKLFGNIKTKLNHFQQESHFPQVPEEPIISEFSCDRKKSTWYYKFPDRLPPESAGPAEQHNYSFRIPKKGHHLLETDICQRLPGIKFNPGYTGKWTVNPGTSFIERAEFVLNSKILKTLDQKFLDHYNQHHLTESEKISHRVNVGNIPALSNPSDFLHEHVCSYTLPWKFNNRKNNFPLYYCSHIDDIRINFSFIRNINDLLIVYDENGHRVSANSTSIRYVDGKEINFETSLLPMPELYVTYANMTDSELEYHSNLYDDTSNVMECDDFYLFEAENPARLGNVVTIRITNTEFPISRLYWAASNELAIQNKNYSNYTTDAEEILNGWSPIDTVTLTYGNLCLFKDFPEYRFERVYPIRESISIPHEPGYGSWFTGISKDSECSPPGLVLKESQFIVKLKDSNPLLDRDRDIMVMSPRSQEPTTTNLFRVHLYCAYVKRIKFLKNISGTTPTEIIIEGDN